MSDYLDRADQQQYGKELSIPPTYSEIEQLIVMGDLSKLSSQQRVQYYNSVCKSIGLNPMTRPFDYIVLNGKLTLYARKDATEQLRKINGVSVDDVDISESENEYTVTVSGRDRTGRKDVEIGVVSKKDMRGDTANVKMKAVTKAKRRFTLSICGLGWLDETEIETIPDARVIDVREDGEIVSGARSTPTVKPIPQAAPKVTAPEPPDFPDDIFDGEVVAPLGEMSIELAMSETGTDGKRYGDCTNDELDRKMIGIGKMLNKKDLPIEDRPNYERKRDAILKIKSYRIEEAEANRG